jgi:membrane fusion protein, multidrug efflux system
MAEQNSGDPSSPGSPPRDFATPDSPPRRRRWGLWIAVIILVLLTLFLVHHCSRSNAAAAGGRAQQGNAVITVNESKAGDMGVYINALGTVTPLNTVTVFSQITGRVEAVHYQEGQMVRKGEPLIDIDPRPSQAMLTQAEGSLQRDQAQLAQARMDLQRYQDAYARNAIAKQQLDDQQHTVAQLEGTVKADQGSVAYDRVQLEYCHIVAPLAGRVGLRLVDPGNTIFAGSNSTLLVITQLQPITVVFSVSEDDLPRVQAQLQGNNRLSLDAFDRAAERLLESGTLTSLDNQVDTTTGTVRFRGEFPNQALALFPNQFVNARLLVQTLKNVTLVPTVAVQHNGTSAFVYVVKADNTVAVQPVTILGNDDQNTAVSGLAAGVRMANSGFDRLENGAHVAIRTPGQTPQPAASESGAARKPHAADSPAANSQPTR